jgi:minor histocompatibility antigen H13
MQIDSFATGMILLAGLFFYDIFWVFGTDVMVTVATSFDAPIKLLFPRDIFAEKYAFALLGLGDIVIPGIFVALCLRYDHFMAGKPETSHFPKPYFRNCMLAYILGLATTIGVMHTFKAAQPALLYLSPACILSVLLTALFQGCTFKSVFAYGQEEDKKNIDQARVEDSEDSD